MSEIQAPVWPREAVQAMRDQDSDRLAAGITAIRDRIARHLDLKTQRHVLASDPRIEDRTIGQWPSA